MDEFKLKVQGISTTSDMAREELTKRPAAPTPTKGGGGTGGTGGTGGAPEITRFGG